MSQDYISCQAQQDQPHSSHIHHSLRDSFDETKVALNVSAFDLVAVEKALEKCHIGKQ